MTETDDGGRGRNNTTFDVCGIYHTLLKSRAKRKTTNVTLSPSRTSLYASEPTRLTTTARNNTGECLSEVSDQPTQISRCPKDIDSHRSRVTDRLVYQICQDEVVAQDQIPFGGGPTFSGGSRLWSKSGRP